jgi:two-component system, cell cycle response regulator DivK
MRRVGGHCSVGRPTARFLGKLRKTVGTRIALLKAVGRGASVRRVDVRIESGRHSFEMRTSINESRSQMTDNPRLRRVLFVDDYPDAREMYSEYLKFSGFDVIEASNGVEALQRAIESSPDIILMDLSLPVMDGWEATRRLKEDVRTAGIPVVALTGHALAGMFEGAKRAGCDAFVTKPCLPEDLVKEIHNVLDGGAA